MLPPSIRISWFQRSTITRLQTSFRASMTGPCLRGLIELGIRSSNLLRSRLESGVLAVSLRRFRQHRTFRSGIFARQTSLARWRPGMSTLPGGGLEVGQSPALFLALLPWYRAHISG